MFLSAINYCSKEFQMSDRQIGTVKWFNDAKGFAEGQKVSFKLVKGQKGMQADEVQPM